MLYPLVSPLMRLDLPEHGIYTSKVLRRTLHHRPIYPHNIRGPIAPSKPHPRRMGLPLLQPRHEHPRCACLPTNHPSSLACHRPHGHHLLLPLLPLSPPPNRHYHRRLSSLRPGIFPGRSNEGGWRVVWEVDG